MAQGIDFEGSNAVFAAPPMRDDVASLPVFRNGACIISCWQLSDEERAAISKSGMVFVSILADGMPPVFIGSQETVAELARQYGDDWL